MIVDCGRCGSPAPVLLAHPRCACGGTLQIPQLDPFDPLTESDDDQPGIWRYHRALPLPRPKRSVACLGEHEARLNTLDLPELDNPLLVSREDLQPSGSWHDRGAALMARLLDPRAISEVVVEDSVDAALSMLHYGAFSGWQVTVSPPPTSSRAVVSLLKRCGARVVDEDPTFKHPESVYNASPAFQVLFGLGAATLAFSLVEALGRVPAAVICPVTHGTMLSGLHSGFGSIHAAGVGPMPQLFGVSVQPGSAPTMDGHVTDASHGQEVLRATEQTEGDWVGVDELSIDRALRVIWREGVHVTGTAAAPIAWWLRDAPKERIVADGPVVFVLTSHGIRHRVPLVAPTTARAAPTQPSG